MLTANTYTNIDGAVLAGGENRRFDGKVKANMIVGTRPIIENTLEVLDSIFSQTLIITNYPSEFIRYKQFRMVGDIFKKTGPLGGIHAALTNTRADTLFVVAGDMPELSTYLIRQMADYFILADCDVLIPRLNNNIEPLHAFYSKKILPQLDTYLSSSDSFAIRGFIKNVKVEYLDINDDTDGKRVFTNINSAEDLEAFRNKLKS